MIKTKISLVLTLVLGSSLFSAMQAQTASVRLLDATGTQLSTHNSISAAYQAIANPMMGSVTIEMTTTYTGVDETLPLVLTERVGASAANSITIRPALGVTAINHTSTVSAGHLVLFDGADWVTLDGSPGGEGGSRVWTVNNLATNASTITMLNGATNNRVRYMVLQNGGSGSASRCVFWGTSPAQPDGNSFNIVEHCLLQGSRYGFNSNGTAANPNRRNIIRKNEVSTVIFSGMWIQANTAGITIDSNVIYGTTSVGSGPFGILFDGQMDTAIVSNNHIYDINNGTATSQVRGIAFRTTQANGTANYSEVFNNFIALNLPNTGSTNQIGIEYAGANFTNAKVYHNTVVVGGSLGSGGTAGGLLSAAFARAANNSNVANTFDIRNNIFINTRSGGNAAGHHVAVAIANTAGTTQIDYNTYGSAAEIGRVGTTAYGLFSDYVTAIGGSNEANSNTEPVVTVSATNLSLSGASLGNQNLGAPFIASVPADIFNQSRSIVTTYRGAHEAIPSLGSNCSGTPTVGVASANNLNLCTGDTLVLNLSIPTDPELLYIWQSAPAGSSTFTDIAGATTAPFSLLALTNMQYRCIAHCPVSNERDTSNVLITNLVPVIGGVSIQSSFVGATYTFTANGAPAANSFSWNFDDGATDTGRVVTHTFSTNRLHLIRVVAENSCFVDSAGSAINIANVSVREHDFSISTRVYPNPSQGFVTIQTGFESVSVRVMNALGAEIANYPMAPALQQQLQLNNLPIGFYYLQIGGRQGELAVRPLQLMR
jgi:hypothetical protein